MPIALAYLRISTDERTQTSMTEQETICRTRAAAAGYHPVEIYTDTESRSTFLGRPGLQQMLSRLIDPAVGAVCVWQESRLYGDVEQQARIYSRLRATHTRLFDSRGEINLTGAMNRALGSLKGVIHQLEVETLRERIYETAKVKAEAGRILGRTPYGARSTGVRGQFEIDPDALAVVRQAYEWAAAGITSSEIERRFVANGITSPEGKHWSKTNIIKLLRNRFYRGELIWNRMATVRDGDTVKRVPRPEAEWVIAASPLGALIEPELWEAANRQISARAKIRGQGRVYDVRLLDGLVLCGRCGWAMHTRRRSYRYANGSRSELRDYACAGTYNVYSTCTRNHVIPELRLTEVIARLHLTEESLGPPITATFAASPGLATEIERLRQALSTASASLKRAQHQLIAGRLDEDDFDELTAELRHNADTTRQRLAEIEREASGAPSVTETRDTQQILSKLGDLVLNVAIPLEERRSLLIDAGFRLIVDHPNVRVVLERPVLEAQPE